MDEAVINLLNGIRKIDVFTSFYTTNKHVFSDECSSIFFDRLYLSIFFCIYRFLNRKPEKYKLNKIVNNKDTFIN